MATVKKRIGIVGCGQWGPNQIRSFIYNPNATVVRICDKDQQKLDLQKKYYPQIEVTDDVSKVTHAPDVDAVVIATPVSTHYSIAKDALLNGKDVLCEKPLTAHLKESQELVRIAEDKSLILMTGYVFLFNNGILKLKELIQNKECGHHYYFHAKRTNLGPVRTDVNAVHDLASHDIAIFNFLLDSTPKVISAVGKCYLQPKLEDVVFISLEYPGNIFAHIHVSWLDPKKEREITVVGSDKMITWNDLSFTGPIEIYSKHIEESPRYRDYGEFHLLVKEGQTVIPHVKNTEPLRNQADHFIDCINQRKKPISSGEFAVQVAEVLERIDSLLLASRK